MIPRPEFPFALEPSLATSFRDIVTCGRSFGALTQTQAFLLLVNGDPAEDTLIAWAAQHGATETDQVLYTSAGFDVFICNIAQKRNTDVTDALL